MNLVRVVLLSWLVAAALVAMRPAQAQTSATVSCSTSPCVVELTATLDAAQAVTQLSAAIAASIEDPSSVGVTTAGMVRVFGGMFGLVWFFWGLGYGVGAAINLVRKV